VGQPSTGSRPSRKLYEDARIAGLSTSARPRIAKNSAQWAFSPLIVRMMPSLI
jgi:hypothetical protein